MTEYRSRFISGVLGEYLFIGTQVLLSVIRVPIGIRYFGLDHYGIS